ncbi:MAG: nucleotidyltransferase domain-containing protein [Candidatus Omnitrophica bacterium]|jgi:predicted nucleotidyltransferase|nr:nucleotidyltransferase domain-containing protein [Candidatus Omnitrophota bacterium]
MDVTNIFKSKTRQDLFRLFFTNPDNRYYLRELERILDIPVSMIRKELLRLEKDGVFASNRKGNLVYYYPDRKYPLFEEIKSIVFKTVGVKGLLESAIKKIKGVETAFIYGSFAKNEENANSDIDLLVVGETNEDELITQIRKIEKITKREINYTIYSKQEFSRESRKSGSFLNEVLKAKLIYLKGNIDA